MSETKAQYVVTAPTGGQPNVIVPVTLERFIHVGNPKIEPYTTTASVPDGTPTLWSYAESIKERDKAIDLAEAGRTRLWREQALEAVRRCAQEHQYLTADDVWSYVAPRQRKGESRAMGAIMRHAVREGWIVGTNEFVHSARVMSHAARVMKWRSLICQNS